MREQTDEEPLLQVRNLTKHYSITSGFLKSEVGRVRAVDGIDFDVYPGETLGIVGESGCGKSTAATTLLRLEELTDGQILFDGEDIAEYEPDELKLFRRRAQMVFQDPESSFDPRMSVGESIGEPLLVQGMSDRGRRRRIVENLLERVGLSASDYNRYPHEFSGGQKQRIGLARALSVNPDLIVADEPVSALDVSIQSEILGLIAGLQEEFGLSILVISHDMGVIQQICDRVAVMYLGQIVEMGPTETVFDDPQHPYTRALLGAIPTPDPSQRGLGEELSGDVPSPSQPPSGCRFHTRCPEVIPPEGYEFEQRVWRRMMDLRVRLSEGRVDRESYAELVVSERDAYEESDEVPDDEVRMKVREEFDFPDRFDDVRTEETVTEALGYLAADDPERAADVLNEAFPTPCEQRSPTLANTPVGHPAACLLHEPSTETEPEQLATDD